MVAHADVPRAEATAAAQASERARLARRREQVREGERREPLRRRILEALDGGPATPTALAELLGVAVAQVSRKVAELKQEGLLRPVEDRDDARRRPVALTHLGELELGRHMAFGLPAPAPEAPARDARVDFLWAALAGAVELRQKTNRLGDAIDRLQAIQQQAARHHDAELAMEVRAELVTTLRQDRRDAEVRALLGEFEQVALGRAPGCAPELVMPALAHREYTLGRLSEAQGGPGPFERGKHLGAAHTLYGQLAAFDGLGRATAWKRREAWCIASLADNMRERSDFERSLRLADMATRAFEELDDSYGRSRALFVLGFCWRLLGDFPEAWAQLEQAHALATENSYDRFVADSLVQMGDVRRCQGETGTATGLLTEALARAERMELFVTQAFALSALGAVAYEEGRLPEAMSRLEAAREIFDRDGHLEGAALNARRQAAVMRAMAVEDHRRRDVSVAARLVRKALAHYLRLRSPAGIAACEIEKARLEMLARGSAPALIAKLTERLEETPQRNLLELDPWVPHVLADFADQTGDDGFRVRAQRLLRATRRRLAEAAAVDVARILPVRAPVESRAPLRGSEMGGESRRLMAALP